MRPTRPSTLIASAIIGLLVGLTLAVMGRRGSLTPVPVGLVVSIAVAALAAWATARSVRDRLGGRPEARPLAATSVPPIAALARACSVMAAVAAGVFAVLLADRVLQAGTVEAARRDAVVAGLGIVVSALLGVAALRLEASCRSRD